MFGFADQEEAEGKGLLVGELGMVTITYGGTNWATLFHKIFPTLMLGQPVHRVTPFEEASALAALVHEIIGVSFLLVFTDACQLPSSWLLAFRASLSPPTTSRWLGVWGVARMRRGCPEGLTVQR